MFVVGCGFAVGGIEIFEVGSIECLTHGYSLLWSLLYDQLEKYNGKISESLLLQGNTLHAASHFLGHLTIEILRDVLEEGLMDVWSEGRGKGKRARRGEVVEGGNKGQFGEGLSG